MKRQYFSECRCSKCGKLFSFNEGKVETERILNDAEDEYGDSYKEIDCSGEWTFAQFNKAGYRLVSRDPKVNRLKGKIQLSDVCDDTHFKIHELNVMNSDGRLLLDEDVDSIQLVYLCEDTCIIVRRKGKNNVFNMKARKYLFSEWGKVDYDQEAFYLFNDDGCYVKLGITPDIPVLGPFDDCESGGHFEEILRVFKGGKVAIIDKREDMGIDDSDLEWHDDAVDMRDEYYGCVSARC